MSTGAGPGRAGRALAVTLATVGVVAGLAVPSAAPTVETSGSEGVPVAVGRDSPPAPSATGPAATAPSASARDVSRPAEPPWRWPVSGPAQVLRPFDPPAQRWGRGHRGVDLPGAAGGVVRAVADGVVSYSGVVAGVGVVSVRHRDGLRSTYQPVADRAPAGHVVRAGDRLGTLDHGHCRLVTCLHLGAVSGRDTYHDPELLLRGWQVRLLPLRPAGGPAAAVPPERLRPR